MAEREIPAHTEGMTAPANDNAHIWAEGIQGAWGDQKQLWKDVLTGQANAKEAGQYLSEAGLGLMAGGAFIPGIGEAAILAGAVTEVGGITFMAVGNRLDE